MSTRDKKDQTRKAADATEATEDRQVDPRAAHFTRMRAAKGRPTPGNKSGKGRDARTVREAQGANAQRGNKPKDADVDQDADKEEDEEEQASKANDLFWKNLVWGAYRSRKRRGEE